MKKVRTQCPQRWFLKYEERTPELLDSILASVKERLRQGDNAYIECGDKKLTLSPHYFGLLPFLSFRAHGYMFEWLNSEGDRNSLEFEFRSEEEIRKWILREMSVEYFTQSDHKKQVQETLYEEADEYRADILSHLSERFQKMRFAKALGTVQVSPNEVWTFPDEGVNMLFTSDTGVRVRIEVRGIVESVE